MTDYMYKVEIHVVITGAVPIVRINLVSAKYVPQFLIVQPLRDIQMTISWIYVVN